ncbi:MAG: hypothetical protein GX951_02860 [Mollicutes bacterium]|nr:hypothetical protein [Mollicutes bacterium]
MEEYIINENTHMIKNSKNFIKVIDKEKYILIKNNIINIVNNSCLNYGSSYKGRCLATKYLLGINYKCPFIVSEKKEIILFSTTAISSEDCILINYKSIKKYNIDNNYTITLTLKDNNIVKINISKYIFLNQLYKASRLYSLLKEKINS